MKRILSLILACFILIHLCACRSPELVNVITLIDRIGEVSLDSEEAIIKAEIAYDALYAQDQDKVKNIDKLLKAREEFNYLVLTEPTNCIQIDYKYLGNDYKYFDYIYRPDGLIQQCTVSENSEIPMQGEGYRYAEYFFTYDANGLLEKVSEKLYLPDEIREIDWTNNFSPEGLLIYYPNDSYKMTLDHNGFLLEGETEHGLFRYENTYDIDQLSGVLHAVPSENYPYDFSIIQIPKNNQQIVMNIMSSLLIMP